MRILVDENISPKTASFLEEKGYDVEQVRKLDRGASDEEVVEMAVRGDYAILTQDSDFGEIYYFENREELKVIVLNPSVQTVESINTLLEDSMDKLASKGPGLYSVSEERIRSRR